MPAAAPTVTLSTDFGDLTLEFFADKAPQHMANFIELAESGFYDGKTFHRIMDGFMIQGGCPKGDGTGNGPRRLKAEFNDTKHTLGVVSMARTNDPDSASCQFFICLGDCAFLDGKYTAFGKVSDPAGLETLKKIGKVPCSTGAGGEKSKPAKPVKIHKMTVKR